MNAPEALQTTAPLDHEPAPVTNEELASFIDHEEAEYDGWWCVTEALPELESDGLLRITRAIRAGNDAELGRIVRLAVRSYAGPIMRRWEDDTAEADEEFNRRPRGYVDPDDARDAELDAEESA